MSIVINIDGAPDYKRDRWDRPLIVPPGGGKPIGYTRSSSAAKTVEDHWNLEMWARRNIVYGVTHDQSLAARALALGGTPQTWSDAQKKLVDKIHEDAAAVAQAHKGADIGTALHRIIQRRGLGEEFDAGPYQADVDAYMAALAAAGLEIDPLYIECRLVCDALQMAGTADSILTRQSDRMRFVADIKTGASVAFGGLGWGAQLACYAHGAIYDVEADVRVDTPPMDRTTGIIIHLPAGQGRCDLYEIDLVAGYRAAQLANEIRAVRREAKRWMKPLSSDHSIVVAAAGTDPRPAAAAPTRRERLLERFRLLSDEDRARFRALGVRRDDLDAVEEALECRRPVRGGGRTAGSSCVRTGTRRSPPSLATVSPPDEGATLDAETFAPLREAHRTLDAATVSWIGELVDQSRRAGVSIHATEVRTERRLGIGRGLVALAVAGYDDDLLVRQLAATVARDDRLLAPGLTAGAALGSLDAEQATKFAGICELVVKDPSKVDLIAT